MKSFKRNRKFQKIGSNAIDGATTRACWGKKRGGYPGVAGKGGATTNSRIHEWMSDKAIKEHKEGMKHA